MKRSLLIFAIFSCLLAACASGAGKPAQAVETYLNALISRDENALVAASCAAWEEPARQEFNSFSAVKLQTQDLACTQTGSDGDTALVACTGKIIANYGAEDQQIDVAGRTYAVVQEGGAWRMCGYR